MFISFSTPAFELNESDKQKHVLMSASLSAGAYSSMRKMKFERYQAFIASFVLTIGLGYIKEASDPIYDQEDIKANYAGASFGLLVPLTLQF